MLTKTKTAIHSGLVLGGMVTLAFAAPANAAPVVFGSPTPSFTGDCTPGCTPSFQTVYSGAAFGVSPVSISTISYFLADVGISGPGLNTSTYTITLSTSVNPVGSLSSNFADNVGPDVATFYVGIPAVPATAGWFTFSGSPFAYNPTAGDLLVDIQTTGNNFIYSSYEGSGFNAQRLYSFAVNDVSGQVNSPGYHIVTQFNAAAVPEPAAWAMMVIGFGMVGAVVRNRSRGSLQATAA